MIKIIDFIWDNKILFILLLLLGLMAGVHRHDITDCNDYYVEKLQECGCEGYHDPVSALYAKPLYNITTNKVDMEVFLE